MYAATNYEGARMFDTLAFAKELEAGGFDRCQAEALATAQHRALLNALTISELATKTDLAEQKAELQQDIADLRTELKQDIAEQGATLRHEMSEMKISIIKWMVGIMLGQSALIIAVMALLHR